MVFAGYALELQGGSYLLETSRHGTFDAGGNFIPASTPLQGRMFGTSFTVEVEAGRLLSPVHGIAVDGLGERHPGKWATLFFSIGGFFWPDLSLVGLPKQIGPGALSFTFEAGSLVPNIHLQETDLRIIVFEDYVDGKGEGQIARYGLDKAELEEGHPTFALKDFVEIEDDPVRSFRSDPSDLPGRSPTRRPFPREPFPGRRGAPR